MNRLTGKSLRRFLPLIKTLILFVVIIGLAISVRSAVNQWRDQSEQIERQLADLDDQIDAASATEKSTLQERRAAIDSTVPRMSNLRWRELVISMLFYALGLVPSGFVLHCALVTMGERPSVSICVASQLLGHVGKYVPGKAMVIVLRAGALAKEGVRPVTATISVFMETFLMMAVGASLSGVIILWLPVPPWMAWSAGAVAMVATVPTIPFVLRKIVALVAANRNLKGISAEVDVDASHRFFWIGWAWSLLSWGLIGVSFAFVVASIPSVEPLPSSLLLLGVATASIALAMVIGFASLLPGGAGIRELVLTTLLGVLVGASHALLAAIAARLVHMLVESVIAFAAWVWLRHSK